MTFGFESTMRQLMSDYAELESLRAKLNGFLLGDPETSDEAVESLKDKRQLDARVQALQNSVIGRTSIRSRISNIFARNNRESPKAVLKSVTKLKDRYRRRTRTAATYGILAPLAHSRNLREELPMFMGPPKSQDVFSVSWNVSFQQLNSENTNTGLLDITEITTEKLEEWWFDKDGVQEQIYTNVWDDISKLAVRLVKAFELTYKLSYPENLEPKIKPIRQRLIKLGTSIARLMYIRHENVDDIRQLFELLVPVSCSFSSLVSGETRESCRKEYAKYLDSYIDSLESLRKQLEIDLRAEKEMEDSVSDIRTISDGSTSEPGTLVSELKKAGIPEISLSQYTQIEELGFGSFSKVWKYSEAGLPDYAVKIYKYKAGPKRTEERFLREATRWYGLDHENINCLLGFHVLSYSNIPALVTRVCHCSLQHYIETQGPRVGEIERLEFLLEIGVALRYLHDEKGMAHGDLRPSNVLLDAQLTVKLSDFGMACIEDSTVKTTSQAVTNEEHLAPELKPSKDGRRTVTQKGDIYAFGCCFLEVFYGETLHSDTVNKLKRSPRRNGNGPKLPRESVDVQLEHWELLEQTFSEKPERRPSAKDLAECLRGYLRS